ncbi:tetratricopeptide repeat protein [Microscilla marina]|uniref:Tetratricopeptide repeat family n=1 Tax=Microscilla marina ATCC 23134 TaxID=313606 RepID=A1ZQB3_MICM2|nr:tetratricopeptide repeat protein [Microscilla marina]EAY27522.1 tetratricopeptide repeat family [Microscilla marina ATCC 23134]
MSNDVIFEDEQGNRITREDLAYVTKGHVDFALIGREQIPFEAIELHQKARQEGQQYGNYDKAIELLKKTCLMADHWPYPVYDLAFTYLLQKNYEQALQYYRLTDELEPRGFFTAKTAIYALEGELDGRFPPGLYLTYLKIEWTDNEQEKLEIASSIAQKCPDFAPAWKELATLHDDSTQRMKAIAAGLAQNPDAETEGNLLINKALVLDKEGKTEEAIGILGNLIMNNNVTLANDAMSKFVLNQIINRS